MSYSSDFRMADVSPSCSNQNNRNIDNLKEWNITPDIIESYKKREIRKMFEWQVECLNNPKV